MVNAPELMDTAPPTEPTPLQVPPVAASVPVIFPPVEKLIAPPEIAPFPLKVPPPASMPLAMLMFGAESVFAELMVNVPVETETFPATLAEPSHVPPVAVKVPLMLPGDASVIE